MNDNYDIINLKGIGEKTAGLYHKLGIFSYEDLLYYFPRDYVRYEKPVSLLSAICGDMAALTAQVVKTPLLKRMRRLNVVSAYLKADGIVFSASWFNMPYLTKSLKTGETFVFRGILKTSGSMFHLEQPEIFTPEKYDSLLNALQPKYPLTKGITNNNIAKSVKSVLNNDTFMSDLQSTPDMTPDMVEALKTMHFPTDFESLTGARKILVYDEFFRFILKLKLMKGINDRAKNSFNIIESAYTKRLIEALPYRLTNAQLTVFNEIQKDIVKNVSMSRLVQGDVGSGKTIIAILAAVTVCISGYQTALMAPTEILATQHFEQITKLFREHGIPINCVLLTGSMKASQKKEAYRQIKENEAGIIIGTHALIQEKVEYNNLALVITDEQHRFGVRQREMLCGKNKDDTPHILVMSATPIPRTLAIILYGDLDVSVIDEVPARRLPVKNCVVNTDYRNTAYNFIIKEVRNGSQVYIICPLVEESEGLDACDVISYTEKLKETLPPDISIAYMHGKMKQDEKNRIMNAFYNNDVHVLVSTTVVEVGVNVPNATVMLIENAERFGLSQLHQLRGRIGRGDKQSYCIFMSGNGNDNTMKRLEILNKSNDGFFIASEDMKLRGPGDIFGIRQSGELSFKLADIYSDADMLKKAADDVNKLFSDDPELSKPEHIMLRELALDEGRRSLSSTL